MNINVYFFFFNDTATTEIYTLSLHDALPICTRGRFTGSAEMHAIWQRWKLLKMPVFMSRIGQCCTCVPWNLPQVPLMRDRKSTRLNSSHANISYAVFCLKKKKLMNFITLDF